DEDDWEYTRIKSLNLTFSGQKKTDQNARGSWSQTTDVLNGRDLIINEARLYFQYKVDSAWPVNDSPNSEIQILINNNTHSETIKLSTADTTFQDARSEGFDVTNLIVQKQNILLSLEVYLADNFILAQNQTISIDNVTLYISVTVKEKPPPLFNPPGQDWALIVYLLIGAIGGIVVVIGLYQGYFKYPPMIRKIRKLKKKIKKRKAKKPVLTTDRDYIIQSQLQNQLKTLDIEKISKGRSLKK
ncbi:MAG: hypothetical protein HWN67_10325, partial [Candidatus Helarchaeota archaeon]|nr:hypothetical protein [Candidatus Helarchaeota archaeon]